MAASAAVGAARFVAAAISNWRSIIAIRSSHSNKRRHDETVQ
jgi:hypothetical protein